MKNTIKILFVLLLSLAFTAPLSAQRQRVTYLQNYNNEPYHFGFSVSLNTMMYTIKLNENYQNVAHKPTDWPNASYNIDRVDSLYVYNVQTKKVPGFSIGIIGSLRLGRYTDLRFIPTLSFGERKMNYSFVTTGDNGLVEYPEVTKSIFSTFVEFPLLIKFRSARLNNIGAYLIGGVNPKIDLASQKRNTIEIMVDGEPRTIIDNLRTNRFDVAAEVGVGMDIYNQWFKFGIELKMSYGLLNIIKDDAYIYSTCIDKLHNKLFMLSFTFE